MMAWLRILFGSLFGGLQTARAGGGPACSDWSVESEQGVIATGHGVQHGYISLSIICLNTIDQRG